MISQILPYVPPEVGRGLQRLHPNQIEQLEEIRFRMGREITIQLAGREEPLDVRQPLIVTGKTMEYLVNRSCNYAMYSMSDYAKQGFFPLKGGHRLGICGTAITEQGEISAFKDISSANLRIARQCLGCGDIIADFMDNRKENILIFGKPAGGKTTLLRDTIRQLSNNGQRIGLVDSRGEVAACLDGIPQLDVGKSTDVISLCGKSQSMEILLRVMNVDRIAVDEITAAEDVETMVQASYCGVSLLATAHGFSPEDLERRPLYRHMMAAKLFDWVAFVDQNRQVKLERMG